MPRSKAHSRLPHALGRDREAAGCPGSSGLATHAGADDHAFFLIFPISHPRIVMWGSPVLPRIYQR
jgi:hypothetical protein